MSVPDCRCPINAQGYLTKECVGSGKMKRILHRSVGTKDWGEAKHTRELWLAWGQTSQPLSGIEKLKRPDVHVEEAVKFFFEYEATTQNAGPCTEEKYQVLLGEPFKPEGKKGRLLAWCKERGIRLVREFDEPILVKQFFMSWKNLRSPDSPMALNTKRAELERYKRFLGFCQENGWIKANLARAITLPKSLVGQKVAWTMDEYQKIIKTAETWTDEYGRRNTPKAVMQRAFILCLRYTGQRLSDTAMFGPHSIVEDHGNYFIALTQIKTGNYVKIPVPVKLIETLRALQYRGVFPESFVLKTKHRTISYGTHFWFWTGKSELEGNSNSWSMDIARVLARCVEQYGKFKHYSTPHTFRHFFAITMLNSGEVGIEEISRWLGHSSIRITERHYSNANADMHRTSHDNYMRALQRVEEEGGQITTGLAKAGRLRSTHASGIRR